MRTPLILALSLLAGVAGGATEDMLSLKNPVFNPGHLPDGTAQTWTFRSSTDNAVARVLVDAEGLNQGAVPDGYAEYALRTQDEVRDRNGHVLSSQDMHAMIRLMSRSFGYTDDPARGNCRGTQCPESVEFYSDKNLRLTGASNGIVDVVTGNRIPFSVNRKHEADVAFPELHAAPTGTSYLCIDDQGTVFQQWNGCERK